MRSRLPWILLVLVIPVRAYGKWKVDPAGECTYRWTPSSLLRGPREILEAPVRPIAIIGEGMIIFLPEGLNPVAAAGLGAVGVLVLGTAGVLEMPFVLGAGIGDTLTGGYFEIGPEEPLKVDFVFTWMWRRPNDSGEMPEDCDSADTTHSGTAAARGLAAMNRLTEAVQPTRAAGPKEQWQPSGNGPRV
jgi:hypothetical protein